MLFTVTQYLESVLNSRGLTRTLGEIDVCRTADGRPVFHTGNSAVIFRIRLDGRDRLLKCYTRPHRHLEAIYGDRFRPAELFLYTAPSEGMWADVVVDDWIEGETLTRTLDRAAANGDKPLVARLAAAFDTLAARLLPAQWAHGDLKPDNLIWDGQRLRPIDFDAMFLPEFRGRRSPELAVDAGRWGFRSGGRFVIPPVWDNGFDFSEGLAAVEIAGRWHFIDTAGRVVLNCPPCDAVKPFRNGTAELRNGLRREKIAHPLKNSR